MTWEEKVKKVTIEKKYLWLNSRTVHFSLFYASPSDSSFTWGAAYIQRLVENGNIKKIREVVPVLEQQLLFFKAHLALARKFKKVGGEVLLKVENSYLYAMEGIEENYSFSNSFGINSQGHYVVTLPSRNYDLETINKWVLKVSRLLQHAEVRCLKHIRFQKTL